MLNLLTDEELIALLQQHDHAAFGAIYERYWEQLTLYTLKVIRSREDAMDIVQEVFVSIWKRRDQFHIQCSLAAYLFKCVRNLSIRYIEQNISRRNFMESLSLHFSNADLSILNGLELRELESKLEHALTKLPPKMQEVYMLSRQENLSYREIADQLQIAETTVKKQVSNALKILRVELGTLTPSAIIIGVFFMD